jgi:hypothetical protein
MGADLIGYMLFGPLKIRKGKIRAAVREVRKLGAEIEAYESDDEVSEDKLPLLLTICDERCMEVAEAIEWLDLGDPEAEVKEIVNVWENETFRDMTGRLDPQDPKRKIVFAGEMTWGDGPDPHSGWGTFERAQLMNVLDALGLE